MSQSWAEVTAWAKAEIEAARTELETPGLPSPETEVLRARIVVMRQLLALKQTPPKPAIPGPVSY